MVAAIEPTRDSYVLPFIITSKLGFFKIFHQKRAENISAFEYLTLGEKSS